jgi:hypothetical protein
VTEGVGRTRQWGGPIEEIRAGDVVWCPPGVKHWHGASPTSVMTHIALTGVRDGHNVEWLEKVSDEQYGAGRRAAQQLQLGYPLPVRDRQQVPQPVRQLRIGRGVLRDSGWLPEGAWSCRGDRIPWRA